MSDRQGFDFSTIGDDLREQILDCKESPDSTNLQLTKEQFMVRMLQEDDGVELLQLLESGESQICERLGLCHGYIKKVVYFDVPRWNNLVNHLRIVNSV